MPRKTSSSPGLVSFAHVLDLLVGLASTVPRLDPRRYSAVPTPQDPLFYISLLASEDGRSAVRTGSNRFLRAKSGLCSCSSFTVFHTQDLSVENSDITGEERTNRALLFDSYAVVRRTPKALRGKDQPTSSILHCKARSPSQSQHGLEDHSTDAVRFQAMSSCEPLWSP